MMTPDEIWLKLYKSPDFDNPKLTDNLIVGNIEAIWEDHGLTEKQILKACADSSPERYKYLKLVPAAEENIYLMTHPIWRNYFFRADDTEEERHKKVLRMLAYLSETPEQRKKRIEEVMKKWQ